MKTPSNWSRTSTAPSFPIKETIHERCKQVSRDQIETTVVARYHYRHEGELAHGYLKSAGIDAALHIDDAGGMDVGLAFVNPARLVVRTEDEARARQTLSDAGMLEDQ